MEKLKWYQVAWKYLLIVLKTISKFLKWAFAAQLTVFVLAFVFFEFYSKLIGFILFGWAILLTAFEIHQRQQTPPTPPAA